jgi:hypothetical protein
MSSLNSLPDGVLRLVMLSVPLKQRMTSCCLVNKRLHAAAVAATHSLTIADQTPQQVPAKHADAVIAWLPKYGHHLTKLQLAGVPQLLQQLPCPNLRELWVDAMCHIQLAHQNTTQV